MNAPLITPATKPPIVRVNPGWGLNLRAGYCAFTVPSGHADLIGDGIDYFERYEDGLPFCHALALTGPSPATIHDCEIIEAHARLGVHRAAVSEYYGKCPVFVRVPRDYTFAFGQFVVAGMVKQLGDKYGYGLILADLLANTALGHWVNEHTGNVPDRFVCKVFTDRHHRICSQAVACALQSALRQRTPWDPPRDMAWEDFQKPMPGCLKQPAETIDPKRLGNDPEIWEPVIYRIC